MSLLTILLMSKSKIAPIFCLLLYLKWYSFKYPCILSSLQWWWIPLSQPLIFIMWICMSLKFFPSSEAICSNFLILSYDLITLHIRFSENPSLTKEQWDQTQISFISGHHYFTQYCKENKEPIKQAYLNELLHSAR